jgi:5'-nucleotidase
MRILVSNDDGIYSPGIYALAQIASEFGEVRIVAPSVEQSAKGHAITISRPLHYHRTKIGDFEAYRVDGTPADCVALGAYHWDHVDLVLSGVNLGLNIGHNIGHSGTVAAAKQAALLNIPAIAFSSVYETGEPVDYEVLSPWIKQVIDLFLENQAMPLLNANLPATPQGLRFTRQSVRHYEGDVLEGEDPMGRKHFWFAARPIEEVEEGTDRWAIENGYVSLTPLSLNHTDEALLKQLEQGVTVNH